MTKDLWMNGTSRTQYHCLASIIFHIGCG
uniref:Uncharacterized protein n=1 Tax=Arundo donax TaxID=35708 RepID=A0A0A8Y0T8_ARUDO